MNKKKFLNLPWGMFFGTFIIMFFYLTFAIIVSWIVTNGIAGATNETTNLFSKVKSENIIVMALVIVGILTCFYYNTFNLKNLNFNLDSLTDKFNNSEFFQNAFDGLENIDDFFSSDEDSDYENSYDPYYVEDIISDFEDDFDDDFDDYFSEDDQV